MCIHVHPVRLRTMESLDWVLVDRLHEHTTHNKNTVIVQEP